MNPHNLKIVISIGPQGESPNPTKPGLSPKQNEEKDMVQHLTRTVSLEKQTSSKRKAKPLQTASVKATAKIIITPKNQTHSKKSETVNNKDQKQRIVSGQPVLKLQSSSQKHSRNESPILKSSHGDGQKNSGQKVENSSTAGIQHGSNKYSPRKKSNSEPSMLGIDKRNMLDSEDGRPYQGDLELFCIAKHTASMKNENEEEQNNQNKDANSPVIKNADERSELQHMNKHASKNPTTLASKGGMVRCKTFPDSAACHNPSEHSREKENLLMHAALVDCKTEDVLKAELGDNCVNNPLHTFSECTNNSSNSEHDEKKSKACVTGSESAEEFSDKSAMTESQSATGESDAASKSFVEHVAEKCSSKDPDTTETPESRENSDAPFTDHWNLSSSALDPKESPESDTGSATTSSDDIKPRSEDYDAGGSQDDEGSNERGISKCSTMLCHDFLGRSSSDTSTPEELKIYDTSLRIEVKMKKENSDLFRVISTSDDEIPRKKPETWPRQDNERRSSSRGNNANFATIEFPPEGDQASSSADETEDEKSENENAVENPPPSELPVQQFHGIVNLAFEDAAENDIESQEFSATKNFKRSVLLSVDECEELGSDDGGEAHTPLQHSMDAATPSDVFDDISHEHHGETYYSRYSLEIEDGFLECKENDEERLGTNESPSLDPQGTEQKANENLGTAVTVQKNSEKTLMVRNGQHSTEGKRENGKAEDNIELQCNKLSDSDTKLQGRPCHLDLHQRDNNTELQKNSSTKPVDPCRSHLLTQENHMKETTPTATEYANTAFSAGNVQK